MNYDIEKEWNTYVNDKKASNESNEDFFVWKDFPDEVFKFKIFNIYLLFKFGEVYINWGL